MKRELSAYQVDLQLFERDDPDSEWSESGEALSFITLAPTMAKACDYVEAAWMKKDETDRTQFEYRAASAARLPGEVLLP